MSIGGNIDSVQNRINAACMRVGRDPSEVTLLCVSKTKPLQMLQEAYKAGAREFGENKVQELTAKMPEMPEDVRWHMIGHLQTNKIKYIIGKVALIHSVDTLHLAEEIEKQAAKADCRQAVLVEINVAGEGSKFGTSDMGQNAELVRSISELPHLDLQGLMTIAPYVDDPEENRMYFRKLREFLYSDAMRGYFPAQPILSMGMTGDYEVAVEEGATHVRVGTGIFGERNYN
ncbi:MAG: YggS family pyridoxal phosphate-dependent enzyme [Lachnospiraceae bacterium]|nr:YggS family pyridoxal phosphate-dependent enzyme [Lachnospiraceae bacterium]